MNTDLPIEVVEELLKAGGFGEIPEPDPETARELERANRALAKRLKSGPLLVVDGEHPTDKWVLWYDTIRFMPGSLLEFRNLTAPFFLIMCDRLVFEDDASLAVITRRRDAGPSDGRVGKPGSHGDRGRGYKPPRNRDGKDGDNGGNGGDGDDGSTLTIPNVTIRVNQAVENPAGNALGSANVDLLFNGVDGGDGGHGGQGGNGGNGGNGAGAQSRPHQCYKNGGNGGNGGRAGSGGRGGDGSDGSDGSEINLIGPNDVLSVLSKMRVHNAGGAGGAEGNGGGPGQPGERGPRGSNQWPCDRARPGLRGKPANPLTRGDGRPGQPGKTGQVKQIEI